MLGEEISPFGPERERHYVASDFQEIVNIAGTYLRSGKPVDVLRNRATPFLDRVCEYFPDASRTILEGLLDQAASFQWNELRSASIYGVFSDDLRERIEQSGMGPHELEVFENSSTEMIY